MDLADNIENSMDVMAQSDKFGIRLEDCDPSMLDVKEYDIELHLRMQPSGVAYFGSMKKAADRDCSRLKRNYELWQIEKKSVAKGALKMSGEKSTISDVESHYVITYKNDIVGWEDKIDSSQERRDNINAWYEAWLQKSHAIREYIKIREEDLYNVSDSVSTSQSGNNNNNTTSAPKPKESWSKPSGESGSSRKSFKERVKKFSEND
jgi:hypothetical protein